MSAPVVEMTHKLTPSFRIAAALLAAEEFAKKTRDEAASLPDSYGGYRRKIIREAEEVLDLISEARDSD